MSDDLVKRLRNSKGWPTLGNAASDRIEELEERLKAATDDAKEAEAYAEELEAKLAKAVGFAEIVERCGHGALWDLARTTLAELKGED